MFTPAILQNRPSVAAFALLLFFGCTPGPTLAPSDADAVMYSLPPGVSPLTAPDPSLPGEFRVASLYYGSGTDRRRPEFRDSVSISTATVDASKLVDLGDSERSRERFWGFSTTGFPVNGRVWYPDTGAGGYPLVLMVHGNHDMKDFSDPGYAYLGELLASRGFVFVSVDMNFLNGSISNENDARGWMLLKHLEAWRAFTMEAGPLAGKADLDRVALIGHSRGGEAVAHAAAFNRLRRYPDDGSVEFDFDFGIRSIIAVAPVDGQYLPTGRHVPLEDINYLVFHGSHDGDVTSFHGLRQYQRLTFSGDEDYFKSAVYVYRANHGQWNTIWNNRDGGPRSGRFLRLDDLLPPEDQRQFGRVYISAFLEATLKGDSRYLPLFRDHRVGAEWLPGTMYVTRFQHSSFDVLADFEEDIDLTSGSRADVNLEADSLTTWKEELLTLRSRNRATTPAHQQNHAARLGWSRDSTKTAPAFHIRIANPQPMDDSWTLELAVAPTSDSVEDSLSTPGRVLDLSITLEDGTGNRSSVRLGDFGPLRRPLPIRILRRNLDGKRFEDTSEAILQTFSVPLTAFERSVDRTNITSVHLEFNVSAKGNILLDDIGFAHPGPGFLGTGTTVQPRRDG